jgi:hypothetical protein
MNENRRQILDMLAAGQITVDEAERLIAALEKGQPASGAGSEAQAKPKPKYLRVVVAGQRDGTAEAKVVNIRVPMQLLRAGVRLTSLIPDQARIRVNEALRDKGMQFDLGQLKPENLEELVDQLEELTVDVNEDDVKVRVFCE